MATQKISVTLEAEAIERARALVGPRKLSAYLDEALREKLAADERRQRILELFDELDAEDPPTELERARGERRADELIARYGR